MSYTFRGKLKVKKDEVVVSDRFKKREFVVTSEDDQYPQDVLFQLTQDRVDLIDNTEIGSIIVVHFELKGREWVDPKSGEIKYFNTISTWRIELFIPEKATDTKAGMTSAEANPFEEQEDPDLPF